MNIGRTTIVVFLSKLIGSVLGFVATVYFARVLGAEVLGIYSVIIALLAWLRLGGRVGINWAMIKRISEGDEQGKYLTAGAVLILFLLTILLIMLFLLQSHIEAYVRNFAEYSSVSVVWYIAGLLTIYILFVPIKATLHGQGLVHIAGILNPSKLAIQSVVQILLVVLSFSLVGMLVGQAVGVITVMVIGLMFVSVRPRLPGRRHFRSLLAYAKYSWLGGLKSRAYNDVDILVLGAFVSQTLIGIYAVAWSITRFLDLFGIALSQTMFPEISNVSAQESRNAVSGLIEDAMAYTGFIVIPGTAGGVLLSDRLLRIYSEEFTRGTEVLWILLLSLLFYTYLHQHLNALNAIDRPDLAFRVNLVFIISNVVLNLFLIYEMGWVGAAIASVTSAAVGLICGCILLKKVVDIQYPVKEIGKQALAAAGMGGIIGILRFTIDTTGIIENNFLIVVCLVGIGATNYIAILSYLSSEFRNTIKRNLPGKIEKIFEHERGDS